MTTMHDKMISEAGEPFAPTDLVRKQHTPTPWRISEFSNGRCAIVGSPRIPGENVCDTTETKIANAEHIVRCVNAHDELVAALRKCSVVIAGEEMNKQALIDALTLARAALAKVNA